MAASLSLDKQNQSQHSILNKVGCTVDGVSLSSPKRPWGLGPISGPGGDRERPYVARPLRSIRAASIRTPWSTSLANPARQIDVA